MRLKDIMHAKAPDVPVQAEDIIFVPSSRIKTVLNSGQLLTSLGTAASTRLHFRFLTELQNHAPAWP